MQIKEDDYMVLIVGGIYIDQMLPEAKERIKKKGMLDKEYGKICPQVTSETNTINNNSPVTYGIL